MHANDVLSPPPTRYICNFACTLNWSFTPHLRTGDSLFHAIYPSLERAHGTTRRKGRMGDNFFPQHARPPRVALDSLFFFFFSHHLTAGTKQKILDRSASTAFFFYSIPRIYTFKLYIHVFFWTSYFSISIYRRII